MDIKLLAGVGLVTEILSSIFIIMVIFRQWGLFKRRVQPNLVVSRKVMFVISLVILTGSILTTLIDLFTVFNIVQRTTDHVNAIGATYFIANTIKSLLLSLLIWMLYKMAAKILIVVNDDIAKALDLKDS